MTRRERAARFERLAAPLAVTWALLTLGALALGLPAMQRAHDAAASLSHAEAKP